MKRADVFDALTDFTSDQHGLFTRAQATSARVNDQVLEYFLRTGDLERVARGIYRFRRDLPDGHEDIWAAWLQLAPELTAYDRIHGIAVPDAVVSHTTAAHVYGLGVLFPEGYEFTIRSLRRTRRPDVRLKRAQLSSREWDVVDGLPVTRPARIVADLLNDHRDLDHIAQVASDAVDRKLITRRELTSAVAPFAERYGRPSDNGRYMLDVLRLDESAQLSR